MSGAVAKTKVSVLHCVVRVSMSNPSNGSFLVCRVAIEKAKDHGYLDIDPPFVEYDYELFKPMKNEQLQ